MGFDDDSDTVSIGWQEDGDDLPDLTTEEGRDSWAQTLMEQDDESLAKQDSGWCRSLVVADEHGNMVMRIVYPDGAEEVFDLIVRRSIAVHVTLEERN